MYGAARLFASPVELEIGGRNLTVHSRLVKHYGEVEQAILQKRSNPVEEAGRAAAGFPEEERPRLYREALKLLNEQKWVTASELAAYLWTLEGQALWLWLSVRDTEGKPTLDEVQQLILAEWDSMMLDAYVTAADAQAKTHEKITRAVDAASGEDERGNSTGPPSA